MNVVAVIIVLAVLGVGGYSLSIYYILHPVDRIEYKYIENNECSHLINRAVLSKKPNLFQGLDELRLTKPQSIYIS